MDATYSQKQEILKKRGITPATKHHDYDYLYKSIITAMESYHQHQLQKAAEFIDKQLPELSGYISKEEITELLEAYHQHRQAEEAQVRFNEACKGYYDIDDDGSVFDFLRIAAGIEEKEN